MIQFRQGLTFYQRQKLRSEILEKELARAKDRASAAHVSQECWTGLHTRGSEARAKHGRCREETTPGARGCLCPCHDVVGSGVVTGTMR